MGVFIICPPEFWPKSRVKGWLILLCGKLTSSFWGIQFARSCLAASYSTGGFSICPSVGACGPCGRSVSKRKSSSWVDDLYEASLHGQKTQRKSSSWRDLLCNARLRGLQKVGDFGAEPPIANAIVCFLNASLLMG